MHTGLLLQIESGPSFAPKWWRTNRLKIRTAIFGKSTRTLRGAGHAVTESGPESKPKAGSRNRASWRLRREGQHAPLGIIQGESIHFDGRALLHLPSEAVLSLWQLLSRSSSSHASPRRIAHGAATGPPRNEGRMQTATQGATKPPMQQSACRRTFCRSTSSQPDACTLWFAEGRVLYRIFRLRKLRLHVEKHL